MLVQGTDDWRLVRCGKVTASKVADIIAKTKSGYSTSRQNYAADLLVERLTGRPTETFVSSAMAHGTEQEPYARQAYERMTGAEVFEIGFVDHPEIANSGASPDGLIGDDGLAEFKCPLTATHLDMLKRGVVAGRYITQIQWQLACTGRAWCDFVSFDPRLPEPLQLFIQRVPRDVSMILELETEVSAFIRELDAEVADLLQRYEVKAAA